MLSRAASIFAFTICCLPQRNSDDSDSDSSDSDNSSSSKKNIWILPRRRRSSWSARTPHLRKGLPARRANPSAVHPNRRQLTDAFSLTFIDHHAAHQIDGKTRMSLLVFELHLGVGICVLIGVFGIDFAVEIVSDQFAGKTHRLSTLLSVPEHHTISLLTD